MSYIAFVLLLLAGQAEPNLDAATEPAPASATDAKQETPANTSAEPAAGEEAPAELEEADTTAEEPPPLPTEGEEGGGFSVLGDILSSGAIGLLLQGGWFMLPILVMAIIAAGVIIERYRSLKLLRTDSGVLRSDVQRLLGEDRIEEALERCQHEQGPVAAILSAGLRKLLILRRLNYDPAKIEEQVVKAMDDYSIHIVAALERHLPILATISSAAPMLGFLGTVAGMITSFQDIVEQMGETNIVEAAADGISVALLTTCFGLIVGIPAFVAFNYFSGVINRFVLDVEESATELIETVTLQSAITQQETLTQGDHSDELAESGVSG